AKYLVPSEGGAIPVVRIDDLDIGRLVSLALKIDAEGGELSVIQGARETISRARSFAIAFEAHPKVIARTKIDPTDVMKLMHTIRPSRFVVSGHPTIVLELNRPFSEQVRDGKNHDIVCTPLP